MTLQTTVQNRKVLADHLARLIGEPYRYLGVPSCAYQVGPYTINRDGSIDGEDLEAIRSFLVENDYIHETIGVIPEDNLAEPNGTEDNVVEEDSGAESDSEQEEDVDAEIQTMDDIDGLSVSIPLNDYTPLGLTCLLKTLYTRQVLINAMTQSDSIFLDEEVADRLQEEKPDTIEKIQELLQQEIDAGMVRGVEIADGKISMDFPFDPQQPTKWQAYADLLMRIEKHSRAAHHVAVKKLAPEDSEMKYFCRNWLMQLGMGGPDQKENRNILLGHLHGYAAFRTADKMEAHKARYITRRREARQIQEHEEVTTND